MDRRYREMRFDNGVKVSNKSVDAADALVRKYLSNVRAVNRKAADYGGSTGGIKSTDGKYTGLRTLKDRASRQSDARRIFQSEGIGRFGARKEAWIAKQYDEEDRKSMEDRQLGREEED